MKLTTLCAIYLHYIYILTDNFHITHNCLVTLFSAIQVVKGGNQFIDVFLKIGNVIAQSMIATEQGQFQETATEAGIFHLLRKFKVT